MGAAHAAARMGRRMGDASFLPHVKGVVVRVVAFIACACLLTLRCLMPGPETAQEVSLMRRSRGPG